MLRAVEQFKRIYGCFLHEKTPPGTIPEKPEDMLQELPDLEPLSQSEAQEVILRRLLVMKKGISERKVGLSVINQFFCEFELMHLLLVICAWGAASEEVPFTEIDLEDVFGHIQANLNGIPKEFEEGQSIFQKAIRLLSEGLRLRTLPPSPELLQLLPGQKIAT